MIRIAVGSSTVTLKKLIQRFARDVCVALSHGSTRLDRVGPDWISLDLVGPRWTRGRGSAAGS
ncbi:TPA: hypothetical protein QDE50_36475 [Burkholderia cenocepacia]|nr:hypothetical protein [Burkholderia cenocepacia]HDR9889875.1 hypothetical protein [Burkholderia cenocepacia]